MIHSTQFKGVILYHIVDCEESQHHIESKNAMVIPFSTQAQFLTLQDIILHLRSEGIKEEIIKQIKLYRKEFNGYVELNQYSTILLSENNLPIKLLIKAKFHPEDEQSQFINKYSTIFSRIQTIKSKFNSLITSESKNKAKEKTNYTKTQLLPSSSFDIAILYANPIVFVDPCKKILPKKNDLIDYETELEQFTNIFEKVKKEIRVRIEIANLENIIEVIRKKPKILHLTCHGSFQIENNEEVFALNLEDQLGKLYKYSINDFKQLFHIPLSKQEPVDIIFLSACHSESIANVFLETQAKCVICVNAKTKILDETAQNFAKKFYQNLLEGKTIQDAFKSSKTIVQSENGECCCCSHLHKDYCKTKNNHNLHVKTCQCNFKDNIHRLDCGWANSIIQNYDYKKSEVTNYLIKLCCCSPDIAHNESSKFIMLVNPEYSNIVTQVLFPSTLKGKMTIVNTNCCLNYPYYSKLKTSLLGRNLELYDIITYFNDQKNTKRTITIYNEQSNGKKTFVRFVVKYLFERNMFPDGIYHVSFEEGMNTDQEMIIQRIISSVDNETNYESFDNFSLALAQSKILLIVDMTYLKREQLSPYITLLRKFINHTVKPKMIIISLWQLDIEKNSKSILLERISDEDILQLLLHIVDNNKLPQSLLKQQHEFLKHRLITWCGGIPNRVYLIKNMLEEDKFEAVTNKLTQMKQTERTLINEVVKQYMSSREKVKEFILMLSIVGNGILKDDIIELYGRDSFRNIEKQTMLYLCYNSGITTAAHQQEQKNIYQLDRVFCKNITYLDFRDNERVYKGIINLIIFYSRRLRQIVKQYQKKLLFNPEELSALNEGIWQSFNSNTVKEESNYAYSQSEMELKLNQMITENSKNPNYKNEETIENSKQEINEELEGKEEDEEKFCNESNLYNKNNSILSSRYSKENKNQQEEMFQGVKVDLMKVFSLYYKSIMNLMKTELISKKNLDPFIFNSFLEAIEEMSICLPTLLKINQKIKDCIDKIGIFKGLCEEYNLIKAKGRLILFEAQFNKSIKAKLINQAKQLFIDDPECIAEAYLVDGILNDAIESSLDKTIKQFQLAYNTDSIKTETKMRISFIISDFMIKNSKNNSEYLNNSISDLISIATNLKNHWYLSKGLINKAKILLKEKEYVKAQETCRECVIRLDCISSLNEKEQLLGELNKIKLEIFSQSKDESKNVFRFLIQKSRNLSTLKNRRRSSFDCLDDKINCKTLERNPLISSLFLKDLMIHSFNSMKKQMIVDFDYISYESLSVALQSSGKLLFIGCDFYSISNKFYRKSNIQIIIKDIIKTKNITMLNYDIIILGLPNSIYLYDLFTQCQVKHIITFNFPKEITEQSSILLGQSVIDLIESFTCDFISNTISKANTILLAFQLSALQLQNDYHNICLKLEKLLFIPNIKQDSEERNCFNRKVVYLFPNKGDHNIELISYDYLQNGQVEDISKQKGIVYTKINAYQSYFGNELHIQFALEKIKNNFIVNIYGCEGIGTKRFTVELIKMLQEEKQFLNGYFICNLAKVNSIEQLKEYFQNQMGLINLLNKLNEANQNYQTHSIKQKILLVIQHADLLSPNYLFQYFHSKLFVFHCHIIIESIKKLNTDSSNNDIKQKSISVCVQPLSKLNSSILFLFYLGRELVEEDFEDDKDENTPFNIHSIKFIRNHLSSMTNLITKLLRCKAITMCQGLPMNIKRFGTQATNIRIKSLSYLDTIKFRNEELNINYKDILTFKSESSLNLQDMFWSILHNYLFDLDISHNSKDEEKTGKKRNNLEVIKNIIPITISNEIEPLIYQQTLFK